MLSAGFDRAPDGRWREPIGVTLSWLPGPVVDLVGPVRWFCGIDPVHAGLHRYTDTGDGRSYSETAHCVYPWHMPLPASQRCTTIVLPEPPNLATIVHELGHVLDWRLDFSHSAAPVTTYGMTNRCEAFAEAFTAWGRT